jgi:2',3'-cyclic-nucleotide 2'-phosphodiesterase / 3'-nucleotidase
MGNSISICITSDVHGYLVPTNYRDDQKENIGLAKLTTVINRIKNKQPTLLIDNGDFLQGSPFTYYFAKYYEHLPSPIIDVYNYLQYDAVILGNHEFNYGLDYLQKCMKHSQFPWLSSNILNKDTEKPYFGVPYVIKMIEGRKIAIIGVTTHYIPNWEDPKHIEKLLFEDAVKATKKWVNYVKNKESPDVIIVSYHGGLEKDPDTGAETELLTGENQGYQICEEIADIDVLITGHQHRKLIATIHNKTVIQTGSKGSALGEIKMEWDEANNLLINCAIHELDECVEENKDIMHLLSKNERKVQEWLDKPIALVEGEMTITNPFQARIEEHPFIEYVNTLQMQVANVSISCTALFDNESKGFPQHITMRDIVSNYIYPNTLKVLRLLGQDIKDALEKSASYFAIENGELTINPSFHTPKPQHYNYDMWEGIEYELDITRPIGERVAKLEKNGRPLNLTETYDVVMNNYRASGGGNYSMFQNKEIVKHISIDMTVLIADNLLNRKKIKASVNNNFKVRFTDK